VFDYTIYSSLTTEQREI